jgi:hypothetical protein
MEKDLKEDQQRKLEEKVGYVKTADMKVDLTLLDDPEAWKKGEKPDACKGADKRVYQEEPKEVVASYLHLYPKAKLLECVKDWKGTNKVTNKDFKDLNKEQLINAFMLMGVHELPWCNATKDWITNGGVKKGNEDSDNTLKIPETIGSLPAFVHHVGTVADELLNSTNFKAMMEVTHTKKLLQEIPGVVDGDADSFGAFKVWLVTKKLESEKQVDNSAMEQTKKVPFILPKGTDNIDPDEKDREKKRERDLQPLQAPDITTYSAKELQVYFPLSVNNETFRGHHRAKEYDRHRKSILETAEQPRTDFRDKTLQEFGNLAVALMFEMQGNSAVAQVLRERDDTILGTADSLKLLVQVEKKIKTEKSIEKVMAQPNTQSQSRSTHVRQPRPPQNNSNIECNYCHKMGHMKVDCYKRQRDQRDRGGNNDRSRNGGNNNNYDRRNSYNNNNRGGRQVQWRR